MRSGEVIPVATANTIPTESVAITANSPIAMGRDLTYAICEFIDSIYLV